MTALPKPPRRNPKPRKRILRRASRARRSRTSVQARARRADAALADRLWSFLVKSASPVTCQRCHCTAAEDPHHLISRRYKATRWLVMCGAHVCRPCHDELGRDKRANEDLGMDLLGPGPWMWLQGARLREPVDPAHAVVCLRTEAKRLGLTPKAKAHGLMEAV